ncbi:MAG: hypothetical protein HC859_12505, partial [Bacteroidia bacterium]|nr:hypothetical protein [Bacteroidia bacterium]
MIVRALIVCIVLLPALASGQYLSDGGKFSLDEVKGCAPLTINITPIESCPCNMEFGDGTAIANMLNYTYTTPGTYKLRILFPAQPSNPFDEITVTVLPNTPPTFEAYACTANAVSVKVTDNIYDQYFIDFNDGNTTLVPSGSLATATNTYATSGPKAVTVTGRYLNAADNCNNATQNDRCARFARRR